MMIAILIRRYAMPKDRAMPSDLNQPYNEDDYSGYAQKGYNLNYIKDAFDENGFVMADSC